VTDRNGRFGARLRLGRSQTQVRSAFQFRHWDL